MPKVALDPTKCPHADRRPIWLTPSKARPGNRIWVSNYCVDCSTNFQRPAQFEMTNVEYVLSSPPRPWWKIW